ncbi:hypothetical protein V1512DRAFT_85621 [Lipomyces arxii]|uniref:uncharacterized protein n=1 Tax=Lipomyces arxii TaxID=56418 RepID=UPI0034CE4C73
MLSSPASKSFSAASSLEGSNGDLSPSIGSIQVHHHRSPQTVDVTFRFHDERVTTDPVVIEENLLIGAKEGNVCEVLTHSGELLEMFVLKFHSTDIKNKLATTNSPLQMSVLSGSGRLALHRGSRNVTIRVLERQAAEADLLTFYIKDLYLTRTDMWRLPAALVGNCIYDGQSIEFVKMLKVNINTIHKNGRQTRMAFVGPDTKAVFRSQSLRYLIFLQMSREMWYFDDTGESYFQKVINSYLPQLFQQWREADTHHLVTIVMFTSIDLSLTASSLPHGVRGRNVRDHFRIVVDRMKVSDWTGIMAALRRAYTTFQKNVLVRLSEDGTPQISGTLCPAVKGNLLEAINVAATQASKELITDDSLRGNLQTVVVSPGSGIFDVEADLLQRTTQNLMVAGLSIDLVCLPRMPLHAVPLFRYRDAYQNVIHCMPHWIDVSFWKSTPSNGGETHWAPRCRIYEIQMMGVMENELSAISVDYLHSVETANLEKYMDEYDGKAMICLTNNDNTHRDSENIRQSGRNFRDDNPLWTTILNPSNPTEEEKMSAVLHGNWKHIYPRRTQNRSVKWKSIIAPAALPITTEVFPSPDEFYRDYWSDSYSIAIDPDTATEGDTNSALQSTMREMVSVRIGLGFQIVLGVIVQEIERLSAENPNPSGIMQEIPSDCTGVRVYLSMGTQIQRLSCTFSNTVSVQVFKRKNQNPQLEQDIIYKPLVQTIHDSEYKTRTVRFPGGHSQDYNWKQLDQFLCGSDLHPDPSRFYRSRFVLIPTELQSSRHLQLQLRPPEMTVDKMNSEEIRLDGLRKLNEIFHREKYRGPEELRRNRDNKNKATVPELKFYTGDLSAFIAQLVESAGEDEKEGLRRKDSLITKASERFDRTIKLNVLAQEIQGDKGIRLVDRRWHWKLHQHCFVGSDLAAWLLHNFKDIDTPEDAVEYGNELMQLELFHHVEHRHSFLDGHYFYQINPEYSSVSAIPTQKTNWFASIRGGQAGSSSTGMINSVASLSESMVSLTTTSSSLTNTQNHSSRVADSIDTSTDPLADSTMSLDSDWGKHSQQFAVPTSPQLRPRIELSRSIKIDVDPQHKSYRRELVTLHYDRLHNPESCYHVQLTWLNTTPKFIEETIAHWSRICDRSGLKLVEVPVVEACALEDIDPFASIARVKFSVDPPVAVELPEAADPVLSDKMFYHKQALARLDYVLDTDAAAALVEAQNEVDIVYSWGKPYFKYSQYVHKTGATLAELIPETGEFLIVRNPLAGSKSGGSPVASSSTTSQTVDPEDVRQETINFLQNRPEELRIFFQSVKNRWLNRPAVAVPYSSESPTADSFMMHHISEGEYSPARALSTSPSSRRPPPPPPSDTPGAANYIYYDLRMF